MKRIATLLLTTLLLSLHAAAQSGSVPEGPRVDRNVELMSIVWRLAGVQEYSQTRFKLYTDRIEGHFGEHKDHALVEFARSLWADHGIGYDAVASMGIHLDDELNLRRDIAEGSLEKRWKNVDKDKFTALLKQFATDTRFDEFYDSNAELYAEASGRFEAVSGAMDMKWFADFFGTEPRERFVIVNGLGNGGPNYGSSIEYSDGRKDIYAVMGAWTVDESGMVVFPTENYLPILIHEFSHSFVNSINEAHSEEFRPSGDRLFAVLGEYMKKQAYTNREIMLNEALVRAAVIKYMKDHGVATELIAAQIKYDRDRATFLWIEPLVAELDKYSAARDRYPTLESYLPRLAELYPEWAQKIAEGVAAAQAANNSNK
jgi:hypothetical protein